MRNGLIDSVLRTRLGGRGAITLVAKWLIHSELLKILGAKGAEEYAERIDRQCVTGQWGVWGGARSCWPLSD